MSTESLHPAPQSESSTTGSSESSTLPPDAPVSNGRSSLVGYGFLFIMLFLLATSASFAWNNRTLITDLFYEASENRYAVMSGEAGPATFYVFHNDFAALEKITQSNEDILGIEPSDYSGIAAMAFVTLESSAVTLINEHPSVRNMVQKNIPMICH